MTAPLFLGRIVATPGALAILEASGADPTELLARHSSGDWGDAAGGRARTNDRSGKATASSLPTR